MSNKNKINSITEEFGNISIIDFFFLFFKNFKDNLPVNEKKIISKKKPFDYKRKRSIVKWNNKQGRSFKARRKPVFFEKTQETNVWKKKSIFFKKKKYFFKKIKFNKNFVIYKIKIIKTVNTETNQEVRFLFIERNYKKSSFKNAFFDLFDVIAPYFKLYIQQRKKGKQVYYQFSKKYTPNLNLRAGSLTNWLKEKIMKNEKYNHLIRNRKKARSKVKQIVKAKRSRRLTVSFNQRVGNEIAKFFWLNADVNNLLNEYNNRIRKTKFSKHFRWR